MTTKEKLIGRAQRVQVAAHAAGFCADLELGPLRAVFSLYDAGFDLVARVEMAYGAGEGLQASILGGLEETLKLNSATGEEVVA